MRLITQKFKNQHSRNRYGGEIAVFKWREINSSKLPLCRNGMLQPMNYLGCAVADNMQHNPQQFIFSRNTKLTTSTSRTTRRTPTPLTKPKPTGENSTSQRAQRCPASGFH
jgi:hypothetical protein